MRAQNTVKKFQWPNWQVKLGLRQKCQTKLIFALFHTKLTFPGEALLGALLDLNDFREFSKHSKTLVLSAIIAR